MEAALASGVRVALQWHCGEDGQIRILLTSTTPGAYSEELGLAAPRGASVGRFWMALAPDGDVYPH
eukprot:9124830-Lingulodinium_polyedra.AAC.1